MTTPTFTPADIVQFAINKDAVNTTAAFDQLLGQRVADAIQNRKVEIAQTMFNEPEEQLEVEDPSSDEVEAGSAEEVSAEEEDNKESEESHENAEQSA